MGVPILVEAASRPVTTLAVCGCTAVWFYIQKHRLSYADVGVSYEKVVVQGQHWRIASATLSHISLLHLLFNMSALWSLGAQEAQADTLLLLPPSSSSSSSSPSLLLYPSSSLPTQPPFLASPQSDLFSPSGSNSSGSSSSGSSSSSSSSSSGSSSNIPSSSGSGRSLLQAGQGEAGERSPGGTPEGEAQQVAVRKGLLELPSLGALPALLRPHLEYFKASVLLALLSEALALGLYHCLITHLRLERYRHVTGVGYSCVVFGWMTILSVQRPSASLQLWGLFSLPVSYAPFESLVLTSFIVPNASFVGHLAGILVGYLLAWGVFSGFNLYWQAVLYFWLTIGVVHSLKTSGPFSMPFLEIQSLVESEDPCSIEAEGSIPLLVPTRTADIV